MVALADLWQLNIHRITIRRDLKTFITFVVHLNNCISLLFNIFDLFNDLKVVFELFPSQRVIEIHYHPPCRNRKYGPPSLPYVNLYPNLGLDPVSYELSYRKGFNQSWISFTKALISTKHNIFFIFHLSLGQSFFESFYKPSDPHYHRHWAVLLIFIVQVILPCHFLMGRVKKFIVSISVVLHVNNVSLFHNNPHKVIPIKTFHSCCFR